MLRNYHEERACETGCRKDFLWHGICVPQLPNILVQYAQYHLGQCHHLAYHSAEHWGRRHHTYHRTVGIQIKMRVMKDQRGR
ncbi:hypothetical protein [Nitrospira sp.]|uniref:hypothetical protein n=1 Tax=Nitrospira sp. TaxID=70125 RepID=UPI003FCCDFAE